METKNLNKALYEFQKKEIEIVFDSEAEVMTKRGYKYKFRYASLPNIRRTIIPHLNEVGLLLSHTTLTEGESTFIITKITHVDSGEYIEAKTTLPGNVGIQEMGAAITYYRRYHILSLLNLIGEEDDDANRAEGNHIIDKKDVKPVLNESQFKSVKARMLKGDDIYNKVLKEFDLTPQQKNELDEILINNKSKRNI